MDADSQIFHFEWILHNGRRKIFLGYRSNSKKLDLIDYRRNGNKQKKVRSLKLQRKVYDELLDILPSLLGYVETFKNSCIIIDEYTVKNEHTKIE